MTDTILIIGAGVAGLAAGCYAQMNGYRSKIFELHDIPGGLCTAWEREDFIFDGCIHYLFGSAAGQPFANIWQELGAIQGRQMIHHEEFMRVTSPDGRTLIGYCDPDRLEKHLKELSPQDHKAIEEFAQGVRVFKSFDMSQLSAKPRSLMKPSEGMNMGRKMMPFVIPLARWGLLSAQDFAKRFKDPFLRRAISLMFAWEQIEVTDVATPLSYERYTGNWQGSTCGWLLTKETMKLMLLGMSKTLPGLKNFYMAGQWVEPGGSVPLAALSARNVIQLICHADGRQFTTSIPAA